MRRKKRKKKDDFEEKKRKRRERVETPTIFNGNGVGGHLLEEGDSNLEDLQELKVAEGNSDLPVTSDVS